MADQSAPVALLTKPSSPSSHSAAGGHYLSTFKEASTFSKLNSQLKKKKKKFYSLMPLQNVFKSCVPAPSLTFIFSSHSLSSLRCSPHTLAPSTPPPSQCSLFCCVCQLLSAGSQVSWAGEPGTGSLKHCERPTCFFPTALGVRSSHWTRTPTQTPRQQRVTTITKRITVITVPTDIER